MSHHIHPLENCLARILVKDTDQPLPSGTGVALHGGRVLTCAHVINAALKLPRNSQNKPEDEIVLDFPLSGSSEMVKARVGFWDAKTDLAELQLIDSLPAEVIPTLFHITDELWDHRVQAFGFPSKNLEGTWADCKLRAYNTLGWVEVYDPNTTGNFIKQGFSGGPVWDSELKCVIGIIVAVEQNNEARVGYLIPAHKIAEKWNDLPVQQKPKPKQRREPPSLLVYQVNRKKQEEDLRCLYEKNNPQNPMPMVAVIHGNDKQAHDMFLARMANEFIPELLKINLAYIPISRIPLSWPTHLQKIADLDTKLRQGLAESILHAADASCEDVQRTLSAYPGPVIIEMELLTDDWMRHRKDILETILGFWNNWPTLASRQHLFVFLYVTHKIPPTNWFRQNIYQWRKRKIFMQIAHCAFHHYTNICGGVFSELGNIPEADVRTWARTKAQEYFDGEITVLLAKIRDLFEKEETIPMESLAFKLKEILTPASGD